MEYVILGKRWAGPLYWVLAVFVAVVAAVLGAGWGEGQAPEFHGDDNNGAPATSASHILYAVGGAALCGLAVLAIASGVFFALWARERRRPGADEPYDFYDEHDDLDLDDVEGMLETDAEDPSHEGSGPSRRHAGPTRADQP